LLPALLASDKWCVSLNSARVWHAHELPTPWLEDGVISDSHQDVIRWQVCGEPSVEVQMSLRGLMRTSVYDPHLMKNI
jgi:hypothetical protein